MSDNRLVIIDGNSLLFRAYFAMRPMVTEDGIYTQGVFAFINMLNKILNDYTPTHIAVAFDMQAKTFRHEIYPDYKGGRQKTPMELLSEIPIMHDVLRAMNICVKEKETYEADDIIGTITADASRRGIHSLIITGDKDELQLIDENTEVIVNKRGMTQFDRYDVAKMKERYGLTPTQFIDLKGLMGDSSDNLPGVPGVGEKKGMSLLAEYGSLEGVIEHKDEIKGKLGENVRGNIDKAVMTKQLATIKRDVPIDIDWDEMKYVEPDYDELIDIYKKLEFNSFIKKLQAGGVDVSADSSDSDADFMKNFDEIKRVSLKELVDGAEDKAEIVIELATDNSHLRRPNITSVFAYDPEQKSFAAEEAGAPSETIKLILSKHFKFTGHDLKLFLYSVKSYCRDLGDSAEMFFDTQIAEYLLDPNRNKYEVSKMLLKHCGHIWEGAEGENSSGKSRQMTLFDEEGLTEEEIERQKKHLYSIYMIRLNQEERLNEENLTDLFRKCEMPLIHPLTEMELNGMKIDRDKLSEIGTDLDGKISALSESIIGYAGHDFKINSPKQLGNVLFDEMCLPYPKKSKGKNGYSTAADVLDKIKGEHPIVQEVLDYRKYAKLKSTYIDGLMALIADDGRIHPHFQQTVAATGRLSCTEPNLQNIPVRDDYGRSIRKAFTAEEGMTFTGADYSQIELRIMASLSGDEGMIESFQNGEDIHRRTASRVFNIPFDEVTPLERSRAKAVNFGIIYGMSGFGLSEDIHVSRAEAEKYIKDYFEKHPAVKKYLDDQVEKGKSEHEVRTLFGRIRQIPEFTSRKYMDQQLAKRLAMNTPIQGTAADIIKIAMNKVYEALKNEHLKSKLVLQIHDELIIETSEDEADEVCRILKENMENAADLKVKLTVEINSNPCWYNLK